MPPRKNTRPRGRPKKANPSPSSIRQKLDPTRDTKEKNGANIRQRVDPSPSSRARVDSRALSFSLATYNRWFGPPHPSARMERIASLICSMPVKPLFVGLQEVTPALSEELFPRLRSGGYQLISQDITGCGYGCSVAVLTCAVGGAEVIDSGFIPYSDTIMARGLVWVHARIGPGDRGGGGGGGGEVLFGTTHLESFVRNYPVPGRTYNGAAQREGQIQECQRFAESFMSKRRGVRAAFITGDLNWDDERKRSGGNDRPLLEVLAKEGDGRDDVWIDAWRETQPREDGYTYDAKENPMLRGNLRRRFDRCLACFRKGATESLRVESTELIGKDAIKGITWQKEKSQWGRGGGTGQIITLPVCPSDHFGLCVQISG